MVWCPFLGLESSILQRPVIYIRFCLLNFRFQDCFVCKNDPVHCNSGIVDAILYAFYLKSVTLLQKEFGIRSPRIYSLLLPVQIWLLLFPLDLWCRGGPYHPFCNTDKRGQLYLQKNMKIIGQYQEFEQ